MLLKMTVLFILFFVPSMFFGCAPKVVTTELDQLFEKDFEGFEVPEISKIKEWGGSKDYPYVTFDDVWESTIIVLMQQGTIVRSSKNTGVIVTITTPPLAVFVEGGEVIKVYLHWMENLYKRLDKPEMVTVKFEAAAMEKRNKTFFDKLSTQLYSNEKWKWLKFEGKEGKK